MYIDANIFVELFLHQEKSQECEDFLEKVKDGEIECVTSDFNIDGVLLAIYRATKDVKLMEKVLTAILSYSGLTFYFLTMEDRLKALSHGKTYSLDFEDSMALQAAIASGCTKIISFDKHFDGLPIKRLEPKDAI